MERQDKEFWKFITGYDYIGLMKTWIMEDKWNKLKSNNR